MKKLILILAAAFMVFAAAAGSASAAFLKGDLILVLYAEGDNEVALNLGDASEIDLSATNVELAATGSWSVDDFNDATLDDLAIGGFSSEGDNYTNSAYIISPITPELKINSAVSNHAGTNTVVSYYNGLDENNSNKAIGSTSSMLGYDYVMNSNSNSPGGMSNFVSADDQEEGEFDGFDYVDLILSQYAVNLNDGCFDVLATATLRVYTDGRVVLNPVPVPGGLFLLGSALLVLTGVRRKNS